MEERVMSNEEFIAFFIEHIPDKGSRMIRYYGFLSYSKRPFLLEKVYALVGHEVKAPPAITYAMMLKRFTGELPLNCILCGARLMCTGIILCKSLDIVVTRSYTTEQCTGHGQRQGMRMYI
jgi:hypothetical protein